MSKWRRFVGILTVVAVVLGGSVVFETRAADDQGAIAGNRAIGAQTRPHAASELETPSAASPVRPVAPNAATATTAPLTTAPTASGGVGGNPTTPKVPAAKSPPPGAPQVPEESATIRDDPTIAPDPKQSADNNVSFPNDT